MEPSPHTMTGSARHGLPRLTARELAKMPTLCCGHTDNLKLDTGAYRFWLSRMGVSDGAEYDDVVTVETLEDGRWIEIDSYPGSPR